MADLKLQFLILIFCINNVISKLSTQPKDWTWTTKAYTFDGNECLSDCEHSQCVVNSSGKMRACYTTDELPFVFYTSRFLDRNSTNCQSNCGYFGMEHQWCVTKNGIIDFCNSSPVSPTARSVFNYTCIGPCTYDIAINSYSCEIRERKQFTYLPFPKNICAPPASIRLDTKKPQPDDSKTCPQVIEEPVPQTCQDSTGQPNQKQCNCDCKNNAEYNMKGIYFKIEASIPHEMVDKSQGNQYHFTINFDTKTSEKDKVNSDRSTEKPASPGLEDNNEHKDQTTDTKPDGNIPKDPSNDIEDNKESDEIPVDMMRSNFGKESNKDKNKH